MKTLNIAHRGGARAQAGKHAGRFSPTPSRAAAMARNWMCNFPPMAWWWCITIIGSIPALTRHDGGWLTGQTPRIKDLSFAELQALRSRPRRSRQRLCQRPSAADAGGRRAHSLAGRVVARAAGAVAFPPVRGIEILDRSGLRRSRGPGRCGAGGDEGSALDRTIFVGFDWRGLARIKQQAPDARCWFTTDKLQGDARAGARTIIKAAGGDGWFPCISDATAEKVALCARPRASRWAPGRSTNRTR